MKPPALSTTPVIGQFVLLALTWGASFLFIKVALTGLAPTEVVLGRLVVGATTLAAVCAATRRPLPRDPVVWAHLLVVAVLMCVVPFTLFAWAEQRIPSGLASIDNAVTPLMTSLVALAALPTERPTATRVAGLVTGFAGVLVVLRPWTGLGGDLTGQLACLAATACYGTAFVYVRRHVSPRRLDSVPLATVQVGLAAAVMAVLAPWIASEPWHPTGPVLASVLGLGALGTGLAYVWNTTIVARWGATSASTVTYLTPVVGVALGAVVLGERVDWLQGLGGLMVVLGIVTTQGRLSSVAEFVGRSRPAVRA